MNCIIMLTRITISYGAQLVDGHFVDLDIVNSSVSFWLFVRGKVSWRKKIDIA